jgi:hypothetical protein
MYHMWSKSNQPADLCLVHMLSIRHFLIIQNSHVPLICVAKGFGNIFDTSDSPQEAQFANDHASLQL